MTQNVAAEARKLIKRKPKLEAQLRAIWDEACDVMEGHFKSLKPAPKSFEVYHITEAAREAFLAAFVANGVSPELKTVALNAVKIEAHP